MISLRMCDEKQITSLGNFLVVSRFVTETSAIMKASLLSSRGKAHLIENYGHLRYYLSHAVYSNTVDKRTSSRAVETNSIIDFNWV